VTPRAGLRHGNYRMVEGDAKWLKCKWFGGATFPRK
jgi:hypothetical protein